MSVPPADPDRAVPPPGPAPRWIATVLLLWLSAVVLGTGFASAVLLSSAEDFADSTSFQVVLCMTGGALGASLAALLAAGERIARGWSFAADALARGERGFNSRLAPLLAVQPILGAALGMLLLLVLSAGAVMLLRLTEGTTFDPMGLLLVSAAAGLFARTLLARVGDSVEALFGRARMGPPGRPKGESLGAPHEGSPAGARPPTPGEVDARASAEAIAVPTRGTPPAVAANSASIGPGAVAAGVATAPASGAVQLGEHVVVQRPGTGDQ